MMSFTLKSYVKRVFVCLALTRCTVNARWLTIPTKVLISADNRFNGNSSSIHQPTSEIPNRVDSLNEIKNNHSSDIDSVTKGNDLDKNITNPTIIPADTVEAPVSYSTEKVTTNIINEPTSSTSDTTTSSTPVSIPPPSSSSNEPPVIPSSSSNEPPVIPSSQTSPVINQTTSTTLPTSPQQPSVSSSSPLTPSTSHLSNLQRLSDQYKGKFVCTSIPQFPHCDIYLCGTLHVAKTSTDMVIDAIKTMRPHYVLLELCEARADSLFDTEIPTVTFGDVLKETWSRKSVKVFGMGLLSWMQSKSANMLGNKLGGEITMAYKVACNQGVFGVILGDRLYGVTIQRIFDKLTFFEKLKVAFIMTWEVLTMSLYKLTDYIHKTESDEKFIREEITRFRKYLPNFAKVIIDERDEYLSQSLIEIARVGFGQVPQGIDFSYMPERKGRILAVVGAGHLEGIQKWLANNGVNETRMHEIASSSKQASTWPGRGVLQVVNTPTEITP